MEPALENLLELAASTRKARGEDARRAMVALFAELGPDHALTREFRRRLQVVT
jgi:thioredoxin-like negative regulator of GroEL